jgi:hypothetical protein
MHSTSNTAPQAEVQTHRLQCVAMRQNSDFNPVLLLEGSPGRLNELARRIRLQGAEPLIATTPQEACSLFPLGGHESVAVIVDASLASRALKKDLSKLALAADPMGLFYLATGEPPSSSDRKRLRAAGAQHALWSPFDDATLRFQLNRAWNQNRDDNKRTSERIPTYLHAQVGGTQRVRDGVVYSLSVEGAFIETSRASMAGATVDLAIRLPDCFIETQGRVVFANVPGNLKRLNLPQGMAVRFELLDGPTSKQLKSYVKRRLAGLSV